MIAMALLAFFSLAVSALALWRARMLVRAAGQRAQASQRDSEAAVQSLRDAVESLSRRLDNARERGPLPAPVPTVPRPGLNINKRTLALRMHRRGDPSETIAAALEMSHQELDLLFKIQAIDGGAAAPRPA
ncbi:MAG TPA: hypothetical protein VGF59_13935 [Bryobacteraceae bacterium]|jgi:hypothetical protein